MSVDLLINDGSPFWYFSPDIWVVPGNDPSGPPSSPIAGQAAYLWARVSNTGDHDAKGVRVDFYWANPALQVTRSNATFVGSSFADVPAGGAQETLCLVPWTPVVVNNGHECLVAVANHGDDPLPNPLPDAFDPPAYPQVAQKNLTVLEAGPDASTFPITVSGLQRIDKEVLLVGELGGELDARLLLTLGLRGFRPAKNSVVEFGLDHNPRRSSEKGAAGRERLELRVRRKTSVPVYVTVRATGLKENEYQLVRILERSGDKVVGGLGLLVVSVTTGRKESRP